MCERPRAWERGEGRRERGRWVGKRDRQTGRQTDRDRETNRIRWTDR